MINFLIDHWILTTIATVYSVGFIVFKIKGWGWTLSALWPVIWSASKLGFFNVQ